MKSLATCWNCWQNVEKQNRRAESEGRMRSYQWWRKQKRRVQKKYHLAFGGYWSPKELRDWYDKWIGRK